ncbi:LTA synthase family protein [Pedobacter agri]|uniref:LTA synthase family protein n=2 Tax=Pedobacter TaxID=84567 RepID=UPI00293059D3|nr:sulfatase-like hydrolase/transferase [Pedobacter agri]
MGNAGEFVDSPSEISLVLNTPFCLIRSLSRKALKKMDYYDEKTLNSIYNVVHQPDTSKPFRKLNVVFLIIESLGKEHVGSLNTDLLNGKYKGYTPFIDSLVNNSYTFTHTYANGRKSIDALPSVISGIPSVCGPFVLGNYSGNKTTSIAKLLSTKGYETAFFHGAPNGSMGFNSYTHLAGIEHYYGKTEYNNDDDFDGIWGIWDEPFMQFMAQKINTFKQPFFSAFFSLSSHHPFKVPEKYKGKFPQGPLEVQEPMGYTDMALKKFFATASKMPWYKNTLFVLCADHATVSYLPEYQTTAGYFSIPILFYYPGSELKGKTEKNVQQIDIMPTVLNYLHYDKPYVAFGRDAFKDNPNDFVLNHNDGTYNLYKGDYLLSSDGKCTNSLYNLKTDRLNENNLKNKLPAVQDDLEKHLKAFIQQYNNRMIENKLTID